MEIRLNSLKVGQKARITRYDPGAPLGLRLRDLGLIEGTCVCCLRKGLGGEPVIYCARGVMLALRSTESSRILVEEVP